MSTHSVISVNPVSQPKGAVAAKNIAKNIMRCPGFADRSDLAMHQILRVVFGVSGSQRHARRVWTLRLVIGSVLMCLGLMFLHPVLKSTAEAGSHGLALAMVAGGAMIACGLLTRVVSLAMTVLFASAAYEAGMDSMLGFMSLICAALSFMGMLIGSGRYSLDTLLFNALTPLRNRQDYGVRRHI